MLAKPGGYKLKAVRDALRVLVVDDNRDEAEGCAELLRLKRARDAASASPQEAQAIKTFYECSMSHIQFGHMILDFSRKQNNVKRFASFEKVERIQERIIWWLEQPTGFTDTQLIALRNALGELRNRLLTARFDTALDAE